MNGDSQASCVVAILPYQHDSISFGPIAVAAAVAAAVAEAEATVESQSRQKRRASPVQRKVHSKARQVNASNEGRGVVVVVGMKRGRRRKEGKKSRLSGKEKSCGSKR